MEGSGPQGTRALAALAAWQVESQPRGSSGRSTSTGWALLLRGGHRAAELTVQGVAQVGLCFGSGHLGSATQQLCDPGYFSDSQLLIQKLGLAGFLLPGEAEGGGGEGREIMQLFNCICSQVLAGSPMPTLISPCF